VSDDFLAAMRIPLLQGRDFWRTDSQQSQKTAIVSQALAKRLFPSGLVLGRHISVGTDKDVQELEIVGVAANARLMDPRASNLDFVYLNYWQHPKYEMWGDLQLRYSGDLAALAAAVRRALRDAGHEYPLHLRTLAEARDISILRERLLASLGTAYAALALTLAGVGLFGLLSLFVVGRTNEIGIRVALGAERRDVCWLVIRQNLVLMGGALLIGLPLCLVTVRVFSGLLYGVGKLPLISLVFSTALLLGVAGIATVIPVRRATSVDPMVALRYD
jgi:ABC-type antimicrobial peptide transport system permease subunit